MSRRPPSPRPIEELDREAVKCPSCGEPMPRAMPAEPGEDFATIRIAAVWACFPCNVLKGRRAK